MQIASLPGRLGATLTDDGYDVAKAQVPDPTSAAQIVATFDEGVAAAKRTLVAISDAKAMESWTLARAGKPMISMPRVAIARTLLLNHSVHHRGQLSVYLRLLDVPVPSIYGPSADENPFA
jgi:uncharacterized damage-inducible protein DinB